MDNIHAESLAPVTLRLDPGAEYHTATRKFQGIPGVERTAAGRFFATWYSGGTTEGPDNYVLLVRSDDDGQTWPEPILVVDPPGKVRASDPVLWIDPLGRLWLFWSQTYEWYNGIAGVWFSRCENPDADKLIWSEPRRMAHGIMMNKPLVTSKGEWLFPTAIWAACDPKLPELKDQLLSNVTVSTDQGKTFQRRGGADVPLRSYDEQMFIERRDGSLWMLVRTKYGIGQSVSLDDGATWCLGCPTDIAGPSSRFFIRRLASGRLLLINHRDFLDPAEKSHAGRMNLTASLSEDDGKTWSGHLLLDERYQVSYPDAVIDSSGTIHVIYDRERTGAREILLARFHEDEVIKGRLYLETSFLKRIVNKVNF